MKKLLTLIFVTLFLFTACKEEVKPKEVETPNDVEENIQDKKSILPDTFTSIMNNSKKFYLKSAEEEIFLKDFIFPYTRETFSDLEEIEVAVTDINNDEKKELFLRNSMGDILFLWNENNSFFGYDFTFRNMYYLNIDGSFSWSDPAHKCYGISKLSILEDEMFIDDLCKVQELDDNSFDYYIEDGICSKKDFNDYYNNLSKEEATFLLFKLNHAQ